MRPKNHPQSLQRLRQRIDQLDTRILDLLSKRAALAIRVGLLKQREGRRLFDPQREAAILRRMTSANRGPLSAQALQAIYREILRQIQRLERSA